MKKELKIEYTKLIYSDFGEKGAKELQELANKGNIQAKLDIIMHNQVILLKYLKKLI